MYRGDPLVINDLIQVRQPTLGEIADFGEEHYFQMLSAICGSPSDFMVALDDMGIRYEEITDFQLFLMLTRNLTPDDTRILLGDLDLSAYEPQLNPQDGQLQRGLPTDHVIHSSDALHDEEDRQDGNRA